ncbi:MAG TPA: ROK family protein [Hyphomonas sp.]|nr:ROK family protein [Hyphomonas sp.]
MFGAIEAGGTKIVCATATAPDRIEARITLPTGSPEQVFRQIGEFFAWEGLGSRPLRAIGVGAFGPVDVNPASPAYGKVLSTPKPGWTGADWRAALARFNCPVAIDTDVNAAAFGEWQFGAGQACSPLAYVTVGTGIGVGILHDGRSRSGTHHYEMGHIYPPRDSRDDGFTGVCPFHADCLEGLASGPAIEARWGRALNELPQDHPAHALEARYLAYLAVTVTLSHMPERILFGGGVMKTPGLIARIREQACTLLAGYISEGPASGDLSDYIQFPALGDDAGITGALILAERAAG